MKKRLKAVLTSAFIYPGLGHFLFKYYVTGAIIMAGFSVPLWLLIKEMFTKTEQVIINIQRGEIPLTIDAISDAILMSSGASMQTLNMYSYALLAFWIIGIVDLYRVSSKK